MTHIASENPYSASKVNGLSDEHRNSSRFKRVCAILICVHLVLMLIFVSAIVGCSLAYVPNMPAQQLQDSILRRLVIFGLLLFGVHLFAIFLLIEFRKQSMRIQHFTDRQTWFDWYLFVTSLEFRCDSLACLDNKALNRIRETSVADQSSDGRASHYIRLN